LAFRNPAYYQHQISQLKNDKVAIITIENMRSQRTPQQNKYWWGVCYPIIAELTGYTEKEVHEWARGAGLPPSTVQIGARTRETTKSTTDLSISEGVAYTEFLKQTAIDLGGYIPSPCEAGYACGRKECEICNPMEADTVQKIDYPENTLGEPKF
jgi:hypothetical protein